jgi:DNA-binding NarL/FixJ family response regulator
MAIRIVLAEDNMLLREGISRLIDANDDLELMEVASDLPELMRVLEAQTPDVVITDIRMPPTGTDEGVRAAAWMRANRPTVGVVILSQYASPAYALALLEHGSAGRAYLLKDRVAATGELAHAIRAVASGGSVIDPLVVEELVRARSAERASPLSELTPRETEILGRDGAGKEQRRDRVGARDLRARGREALQLDLPEVVPDRREGRQPSSEGRADVPQRAGEELSVRTGT